MMNLKTDDTKIAFEEGYCYGIQGALIHLMGLLSWDILKIIIEEKVQRYGYTLTKKPSERDKK